MGLNKMKILITGGMGFIGTKLAEQLRNLSHDVTVVDTLSPQIHGEIPLVSPIDGVKFIRKDVLHLAEHPEILDGSDVIYHLAAETGTAQSMYRISNYVRTNELGTAALLEGVAKCGHRPKKIILASSRSIYGEGAYRSRTTQKIFQPASRGKAQLEAKQWEHIFPNEAVDAVATPESLSPRPGSIYAATKYSQEMLLAVAGEALGFKAVALRFQNVYGEGQSLMNPYTGIISIFYNRARQGLPLPIYEDGKESRDFIHVSDVVHALIDTLDASLEHGIALNIGSGKPTSVHELAKVLCDVSGFDVDIEVTGQYRVGDIRHCYADLTRVTSELGFEPQVSLAEGLRRFANWASGQPTYEDRSSKALHELKKMGLSR